MQDLHLALSVFGLIFVAELPDKTALAALVLATRYRPWPVFLGAALALTVQSAVAVVAGSVLSLLPPWIVHIGAGVVFLVSAVFMWQRGQGEDDDVGLKSAQAAVNFWGAFATVFGVVFVAEWGDLTQFATAALAARERAPWVVFSASTLALWAVTAIAVGIGHRAAHILSPKITARTAAVLFAGVGLALLVGRF